MTGSSPGFPVNRPYRHLKKARTGSNAGGHYPADPVTERAREIIAEVAAYLEAERAVEQIATFLDGASSE